MSLEGNSILTGSIQASNWVQRLFASVQGGSRVHCPDYRVL